MTKKENEIDIELQQKGKQNWLNSNYSKEELEENIKKQWAFLQKVHALKTGAIKFNRAELPCSVGDLAIEIRTLKRLNGECPAYANHRIYSFTEKQFLAFRKKMMYLYERDIPFCTYWSVYNFNSKELAIAKTTGNKAKEWNNRIATNNAVGTSALVMDFDHITESDFLEQKSCLTNLGIETIDIFSGHGYQCYILLNEFSVDKTLLYRFTNLLLSKGFPVDIKIKDFTRIMRLTNSLNSKECYKGGNPVKTFVLNDTDNRYSIEDVFNKLDTLPTVMQVSYAINKMKDCENDLLDDDFVIYDPEEDVEYKNFNPIKKKNKIENIVKPINTLTKINKNLLNDIELQQIYPMLKIEELPVPVKLMLSGFQSGYANSALMFLVLYFRDKEGFTLGHIQNIIEKLSFLDTYNYAWHDLNVNAEVKRFFYAREYKYTGIYMNDLQEFGYMEFPELTITDKSILVVNNYVFKKLPEISSKAFIVYLKLIMNQHKTGNSMFHLDNLKDITGISKRTVQHHLQDLVKVGLLDKKRMNRRKGEEYIYFISKFATQNLGFTKFNISTLNFLFSLIEGKKISDTEFSICLYLRHMCYTTENVCYPSQETIGQAIGITRTGVTKCFKRIVESNLISLERIKIDNLRYRYNIELYY